MFMQLPTSDSTEKSCAFDNIVVRQEFIRKIYTIFTVQLLLILILSATFIVAIVAAYDKEEYVLIAVSITATAFYVSMLFAFQTDIDFTGLGRHLVVAFLLMVLSGLIINDLPPSNAVTVIYCLVGIVVFSLFVIYNTQLMVYGHYKYVSFFDDYVLGALSLYFYLTYFYVLKMIDASSVERNEC